MTNICGVLYACTLFVGVTNAMTVQHVASMQRWVATLSHPGLGSAAACMHVRARWGAG